MKLAIPFQFEFEVDEDFYQGECCGQSSCDCLANTSPEQLALDWASSDFKEFAFHLADQFLSDIQSNQLKT
jgi:hypothetical protein